MARACICGTDFSVLKLALSIDFGPYLKRYDLKMVTIFKKTSQVSTWNMSLLEFCYWTSSRAVSVKPSAISRSRVSEQSESFANSSIHSFIIELSCNLQFKSHLKSEMNLKSDTRLIDKG